MTEAGRQYLAQLEREREQREPHDGHSILDTIGGFLFNNTAKFVNQGGVEVQQLSDALRMLIASKTNNTEAYRNASEEAKKDANLYGDKGGLFNAGTLTTKKEAKKGDLKTGLEKIGGGTLGTAAEVLPFSRGATLARSGAKFGEKVARGATEGALYGGAYGTASGLVNGDLSAEDSIKSALMGALLGGGVGGALGKFGNKAASSGANKVEKATASDTNSLGQKLLGEGNTPRRGDNFERLSPEDAALSAGTQKALPQGDIQSPKGEGFTIKSPSEQYATDTAVKRIREIDADFAKAQQSGAQFQPEYYRQLNKERDSLQKVVVGDKTLGEHRLAEENGFPAQSENISTDLAEKNLAQTTPQEAANTVAEARFIGPGAKSVYEDTSEKAKTALLGTDNPSISERMSKLPSEESAQSAGAKSIAEKVELQNEELNQINQQFNKAADSLNKGSIQRQARKWSWLNHYTDTLGNAGRFFGATGTNIVHKLAEGAKKVSDIQETVMPDIQKSQKLMKELAKSDTGKSKLQARIYDALEDRANAAQYLHGDKEMELFKSVANVLDTFKQLRQDAGKQVIGENYSPRAVIRSALDAPENMWQQIKSTFGGVESTFSKTRYAEMADDDINKNIVDLLPTYVSSQAKELSYEGAIDYAKQAMDNLGVTYLSPKEMAEGKKYMGKLIQQVLEPRQVSNFERWQNKVLGVTYQSQLGFSPRFALQNMTQRWVAQGQVSKEAANLAKIMDKSQLDSLRLHIHSGDNPIMESINVTPESVGTNKGWFGKYDIGHKVERGNVHYAFDRGAAQAIVKSDVYKNALKQGLNKNEAAALALKNPKIRDQAIRHGNVLVNTTQFGANFVTKPEFFRNSGTFFGISDRWFKQYHRFPMGMMQSIATIMNANDARALDVLRRANPLESRVVEFRNAADAYHNAAKDLVKAVKNGEVNNVSLDEAQGYEKALSGLINKYDSELKKASEISGPKQARHLAKMWAAAAGIQFIFNGGGGAGNAILYSAPVNLPTRENNPLAGATVPSSPVTPTGQLRPQKALNMIPGVGLVTSRTNDVQRFLNGLTGDNSQ